MVGVSAWFPVAEARPETVTGLARLRSQYERIFRDYLGPLSRRNPARPIVFLEYGAMDMVQAPGAPDDGGGFPPFVFADGNGNGVDDGRETQANMYQALLDTVSAHPGVLNGVFWWDNWMTEDERWASYWAGRRSFTIRDKPAEAVVRSAYAAMADNNSPPVAVGEIPLESVRSGDRRLVNVTPYFRDPDGDGLTYAASSSEILASCRYA